MNFLTSWLLSVIGTAFLVSVAEALMPDEKVRQVGHLAGGLLMMMALLTPLLSLRFEDWDVSVNDYFLQIEEKKTSYRQNQEDSISALIREQSETYIEEAAQKLDLTVHAEVRLSQTEVSLPQPASVLLDIPYNAALSAQIESDLGIAPQKQSWDTKETG